MEFMSGEATRVDSVVWCTGYDKNPSYLHEDCGIRVIHDGHVLDPLYLHLINMNHPTMAILNIVSGTAPFPQIDLEVRCFLALHTRGQVPGGAEMLAWLGRDQEWRAGLGLAPRHRHLMMSGRLLHWQRHAESLARAGSTPPLAPVYGRMLLYTVTLILVKGLPFTRTVRFSVSETRTSFSVSPSLWTVNCAYYILLSLMSIGFIQ